MNRAQVIRWGLIAAIVIVSLWAIQIVIWK